ncbi:MAG: hypothetical protein K0R67_3414 [Paenibacillus sp.]|jgi:hypothetical protein|nr:hypothetical protein [Paenibacillus sp.]
MAGLCGMMLSMKAQWYYEQLYKCESHVTILTGHLAKGSFGKQQVNARIRKLRYKVHQGLPDVQRMLMAVPSKKIVLVHASQDETDKLCVILRSRLEGCEGIYSLMPGETLKV